MRDYQLINECALSSIHQVLGKWLPEGKCEGNEYVAFNPTRVDNRLGSFKINLKTGIWSDFSTNDKGGDLISLVAYLDNVSQSEAADRIGECFHLASKNNVTSVTNVTNRESPRSIRALSVTKELEPLLNENVTCVTEKEIWTPFIPIPKEAPPPPSSHPSLGVPSYQYVYCTELGEITCYLYRFEYVEQGKRVKHFLPLTYCQSSKNNKAWRWQSPPAPRVLYNLDCIAAYPSKPIIFFEGEKCVDAGTLLFPDFVATTTLHGANSPHKTDLSCLNGKKVLIWPDNDESGKKYAENLAHCLHQAGVASVHFMNLDKLGYIPEKDINGDPILIQKRTLPEKWDAADALSEGFSAAHIQLILNDSEGLIEYKPKETLGVEGKIQRPKVSSEKHTAHYTSDKENGVLFHEFDHHGEPLPPKRICSHLEITALTRNQNSENWGRLLEFNDKDGVHHQFALPMELMSGDGNEYRKELLRLGLEIESGRSIYPRLDTYIKTANPEFRAICTDRIGWHKTAFILPNKTIGKSKEHVIFQSAQAVHHHFNQNGSLEDWQNKISRYCVGNSRLIFALSAAFAAPLLHLLGDESGGFNFVGPSSCGKTTALKVAASIWGSPDYVQRWRATANGLEGIAHMHNDALLVLDELAQVDPKDAGDVAYMLANGQGKVRAQKNGFARASMNWRILFLSAGEVGLAEHMNEANKRSRAGQEVRLADIPADAGKDLGMFETLHELSSGEDLSNVLNQGVSEVYGIAGITWLGVLTDIVGDPSKIFYLKKLQKKFIEEILPPNASSQVRRVATRMGLIAAAGEYATAMDITGWPSMAAQSAVKACFEAWVAQRGGIDNQELIQTLSQVRAFFEANGESQFTKWDEGSLFKTQIKTRDRAGFYKTYQDQTEYYVFTEAYERRICQGLNKRNVTKILANLGWIKLDKDNKPYHSVRLPEMGSVRCYIFTPKMWDSDAA